MNDYNLSDLKCAELAQFSIMSFKSFCFWRSAELGARNAVNEIAAAENWE